mgnify:CR=1 FL=1
MLRPNLSVVLWYSSGGMEMVMLRWFLMSLLVFVVSAPSHAKRKSSRSSGPPLMPQLQEIIGDNYEVPPELSDKAQPGSIVMIQDGQYVPMLPGCVAGAPSEFVTPTVKMKESLSVGVKVKKGGWGARTEGSTSTQLGFVDPHILGYPLMSFSPSESCIQQVRQYAQQRLTDGMCEVFVIQESLLARIKGCGTTTVEAGVRAPLVGSATVSSSNLCEIYSDKPVVLGVRAVRLRSHPSFAFLNQQNCECGPGRDSMCRPGCGDEIQMAPERGGPGSGCKGEKQ